MAVCRTVLDLEGHWLIRGLQLCAQGAGAGRACLCVGVCMCQCVCVRCVCMCGCVCMHVGVCACMKEAEHQCVYVCMYHSPCTLAQSICMPAHCQRMWELSVHTVCITFCCQFAGGFMNQTFGPMTCPPHEKRCVRVCMRACAQVSVKLLPVCFRLLWA